SEQVAHLLDPCNRLPRFEYQQTCVLLLQSALHFLPRDRRRNRGMLASAQRINSYRSFMFVILAPIDKYLPGSNLLLHVGDDHLRMVVLEQLRQRMGKGLGQFVFSGTYICSPLEPDVFGKLCNSKCSKTSRSHSPTWQHCTMLAGGPGSRSNTIIVGQVISFARASDGCSSIAARFASHTSVGKSLARM